MRRPQCQQPATLREFVKHARRDTGLCRSRGPDLAGCSRHFYFRNVTEIILFGTRGKNARTLPAGRRQVNLLATRKREHSRKPDEQYDLIEGCSAGPFLELFGRGVRKGWTTWGNQAHDAYEPDWETYAYNSRSVAAE
jgi:N6-adenosine-specific RNA methylase IME4